MGLASLVEVNYSTPVSLVSPHLSLYSGRKRERHIEMELGPGYLVPNPVACPQGFDKYTVLLVWR